MRVYKLACYLCIVIQHLTFTQTNTHSSSPFSLRNLQPALLHHRRHYFPFSASDERFGGERSAKIWTEICPAQACRWHPAHPNGRDNMRRMIKKKTSGRLEEQRRVSISLLRQLVDWHCYVCKWHLSSDRRPGSSPQSQDQGLQKDNTNVHVGCPMQEL